MMIISVIVIVIVIMIIVVVIIVVKIIMGSPGDRLALAQSPVAVPVGHAPLLSSKQRDNALIRKQYYLIRRFNCKKTIFLNKKTMLQT